MDQAVYAENGEKRARSGRLVAWALTFTLLQVLSLLAVLGVASLKMPFFNQELNTEGLQNKCIIPTSGPINFTGPKGEALSIDAKETVDPREGVLDKEGNPAHYCASDADCATGQTCGTLSPSTALLRDQTYKLAQEKNGVKFPRVKVPSTEWFNWGFKGIAVVATTPIGLMPPFIFFIVALLVGIPLQRRAMRHLNALQLSDVDRARLTGEMKQMGAAGEDPSRVGRLIAAAVGAVLFLAVAYPVFTAGAWFFSGLHEIEAPKPSSMPKFEIKGGGEKEADWVETVPDVTKAKWGISSSGHLDCTDTMLSDDGKRKCSAWNADNKATRWDSTVASSSMDVTSQLKSPLFDAAKGPPITLRWDHEGDTPAGPNGFNCDDARLSDNGRKQCSSWLSGNKMQPWLFVFPIVIALVCLFPFFPILPLLGARFIGVPLQRKATFGLSDVKIGAGEASPLNSEMARDGSQAKAHNASVGRQSWISSAVGTAVAFPVLIIGIVLFIILSGVLMPTTQQLHDDFLQNFEVARKGEIYWALRVYWMFTGEAVPWLLLMVFICMGPIMLARLIGKPLFQRARTLDNAHVVPITDTERRQYEAEFYKTALFIRKAQMKRVMRIVAIIAMCIGVLVLVHVPLFTAEMAAHFPADLEPLKMVLLFLTLPATLPLVAGLLAFMNKRRQIREGAIGVGA